jgi:protein phosphatase
VRQVNEDRAWSGKLADGWTAVIVADGMGGHRAGDVASELAVNTLADSLQQWPSDVQAAQGVTLLQEMISKANKAVFETAALNEKYHNMGTTLAVAVLGKERGWIGHVGDSRIYRFRNGGLEQLTDDHTVINELSKAGQLSPEEAARHPLRHAVTRSVGTDREVKADVRAIDLQPGDRLLLCSDGLSGLVEPEKLLAVLGSSDGATLDEIADRLVEMALDAGGDDNVTVVLVEADQPDTGEGAAGGEPA